MQKRSIVLLVALLGAAVAHGRKLRQDQTQTVRCRGGQCYIVTMSGSGNMVASSIAPLDTTGITSTGSYEGTFACYASAGLPDWPVEKIDGVVQPAVVSITSGGMRCISSAPLFCDAACCRVTTANVTAQSCLASALAGAPAAAIIAAPATAPTAPMLNISTAGVACTSDGCTLNGTKLSTQGITTTGTYSGLFECFTPPVDAPIADIPVNATNKIMPGSITNLNKSMQCVFDGQIQCDVSCCTIGSKKSCLTVPI